MHHVLLLGGDPRQQYLNRLFIRNGFSTALYYEPGDSDFSMEKALELSDIILCPIPFTKDGKTIFSVNALEHLDIIRFLKHLTPEHRIFGGNIPSQVKEYTHQNHIFCFDYMHTEEITLANTAATAEGAIAEAIRLSPLCLHNHNCLVMGFGRCGKTLSMKLKGLHARVTVTDQDTEALALASTMGFDTVKPDALNTLAGRFPFIFNTVPAPVLEGDSIKHLNQDVTIIDIASAPGGVDFIACKKLGVRAKLCPGLPGIYAPQTSAEILYQEIVKYLS